MLGFTILHRFLYYINKAEEICLKKNSFSHTAGSSGDGGSVGGELNSHS